MVESGLLQLLLSVLHSTVDAIVKRLGLHFRVVLYKELHRLYFEGLTYYKVAFVDKRLGVCRLIREQARAFAPFAHFQQLAISFARYPRPDLPHFVLNNE